MKKFEITYKNLNVCFGNNTFTKVLDGENAKDALLKYAFEQSFILEMIEAKEL